MLLPPLLTAFSISLLISGLATPLLRRLAIRSGFYAMPVHDRWHSTPVPLLGGLGIALGFAGALVYIGNLEHVVPLLLCTGMMFGLGAIDDLWHVPPSAKLVAQVVIAGLVLTRVPPVSITGAAVLDQLLALIWIVGLTNAFNLLDNMDGLAAGVAALSGVFYLALLLPNAQGILPLAVAGFVGATVGFLLHNFPPASIFMGDSGAFLLGSFLAGTSLFVAPEVHAPRVPVVVVPLFVLLVPIFDTGFVTLTRQLSGRSALLGGKDHTSHRLVALGVSERRAVVVLYALAAAGGLVALAFRHLSMSAALGLVALYLVALGTLAIVLGHVPVPGSGGDSVKTEVPFLSEVAYRRRTLEMLLDLSLLSLAYYAAFRLRFQQPELSLFFPAFVRTFPIVVGAQLAGLYSVGKYRQVWSTVGPAELGTLLRGLVVGVGAALLLLLMMYRFEQYSRGVFLLDVLIAWFLLVGARTGITSIDGYLRKQRAAGRLAIIYGAGRGGALLARELLENRDLGIMPVGFLDEDITKRRLRIEGLPVLGTGADLPGAVEQYRIAELLVSIRDIDNDRLAALLGECRRLGITLRRMRFSVDEIRSVVTVVRHDR